MIDQPIVSVRDFRKRYGAFVAVDGISFEAGRGEIFGLLGPNGAGKTTTLECLEGIRQPDGGSLAVLGVDPGRQPRKLRNLIGVQLQSGGLPGDMTVDEAMRFFCAYHGVAPRYDLLDRLGLQAKRRPSIASSPPACSGGWPWRWRSATTRPLSSWTSRPPGWTWARAPSCTR